MKRKAASAAEAWEDAARTERQRESISSAIRKVLATAGYTVYNGPHVMMDHERGIAICVIGCTWKLKK
jgi:hypothetical protein